MTPSRTPFSRLRRRAARLGALVFDPRARSEVLLRLRFGSRVHQNSSFSAPDRYRVLFAAARDSLGDKPDLRVLSYGCSSGEEVLSLRGYFPSARLVGAEINPVLLRQCRRLPPDPRRRFIASRPETIAAEGPYDAIFAMAVFTRQPHAVALRDMHDISEHYPYPRFAADLAFLAGQVAPGGLLIVEHALYLVEDALADAAIGAAFRPVAGVGDWLAKGPRFAPDGRRIDPQPPIARIFRRESLAGV